MNTELSNGELLNSMVELEQQRDSFENTMDALQIRHGRIVRKIERKRERIRAKLGQLYALEDQRGRPFPFESDAECPRDPAKPLARVNVISLGGNTDSPFCMWLRAKGAHVG